jgi:hypothetical protein
VVYVAKNMKRDIQKQKVHISRFAPLLGQLLKDLRPAPERVNIRGSVDFVEKNKIKDFCLKNKDDDVYEKMMEHELVHEPVEKIVVFTQENGEKIEKIYFDKILVDLGYNVDVLFSKNHGSDYEAATNINGYSIPGWGALLNLLRKLHSNLYVFLGKRFAPGFSRLHIRIFEGKNTWYVIAHIDIVNWLNIQNVKGIFKSHVGSGQGDYQNGTKYFAESLKHYFE